LLLGGGGFIGSALAARLKQEKKKVYVIGRKEAEHLEQTLPQCSTLIHLASTTTPGLSANNPELELDNIAHTLRLQELLKKQSHVHVIFFSSGGTVYGNPEQFPVKEDAPIAPLSNHGASKAAQEAFFQVLRTHGHAVTILRPSNAYGPGQTLKRGFGLVRTMLEHARADTQMEIWGDGENIRDFIYIDDVVEASVKLVEMSQDSGTYNLGSGKGYSVNQILKVVEEITGVQIKIAKRPVRTADVRALILNINQISEKINWIPKVDLEKGINQTWAWIKSAK
jgi:UDP-glucose 4-epimerase